MRASFYALAGSAAMAMAAVRGFNYGSQSGNLDTFTNEFESAQAITDYASARLYTMIQEGTANTVISAIPAAIKTNTTLLLGLWASSNQETFNNELSALKTAIDQFGSQGLADLTVGISVGSEDLYRISEIGIKQKSGYGQTADVLVNYIGQVRELVKGTVLANVPIGHVDTWNAFTNTSNSAILGAVDFFGLDEYPFYQDGEGNSIDNASNLFWQAYDKVEAVAGGKPLWVTETGWPISGANEDQAVPSVENAAKYWQEIACELEARCINFWWYILNDNGASPSFSVASGIDGANTKPLYDLKCPNTSTCGAAGLSAAASSSSSSASSSAAASSKTASGSASSAAKSSAGSASSAGSSSASAATSKAVSSSVSSMTSVATAGAVGASGAAGSSAAAASGATAAGAAASGAAASGSGSVAGQASGTTLASSWAANQTPGTSATASPSAYKGAGAKIGGSVALALGAAAVALL